MLVKLKPICGFQQKADSFYKVYLCATTLRTGTTKHTEDLVSYIYIHSFQCNKKIENKTESKVEIKGCNIWYMFRPV